MEVYFGLFDCWGWIVHHFSYIIWPFSCFMDLDKGRVTEDHFHHGRVIKHHFHVGVLIDHIFKHGIFLDKLFHGLGIIHHFFHHALVGGIIHHLF